MTAATVTGLTEAIRIAADGLHCGRVAIGIGTGTDRRTAALAQLGLAGVALPAPSTTPDGRWLTISHLDDVTVAASADRPIGVDLCRADHDDQSLPPRALLAHGEDQAARGPGQLLAAKEAAGKIASRPLAVVLDPRELRLQWSGDDFEAVAAHGSRRWGRIIGTTTVVGDVVVAFATTGQGDAPRRRRATRLRRGAPGRS